MSAALGEFGPVDGEGFTYNFKRIYHWQGFIPWVVFGLAFVCLKENRNSRASLLLIPVAVVGLLYLMVRKMMGMPSGVVVEFNAMFKVLVLGFSMVWLLADRIGNRNRFVTFVLAALIYLGFLGVAVLGGGFGEDMVVMTVFAGFSIGSILLAFFLAGVAAGKPFRKKRFLVCLPVGLFVPLLVSFAIAICSGPRIANYPLSSMIGEILMFSFFTSLIFYIASLPFVVLLLNSAFWRKRFEGVLGVGSYGCVGSEDATGGL